MPFVEVPLVMNTFLNLSTVHGSKDALTLSIAASFWKVKCFGCYLLSKTTDKTENDGGVKRNSIYSPADWWKKCSLNKESTKFVMVVCFGVLSNISTMKKSIWPPLSRWPSNSLSYFNFFNFLSQKNKILHSWYFVDAFEVLIFKMIIFEYVRHIKNGRHDNYVLHIWYMFVSNNTTFNDSWKCNKIFQLWINWEP